MQDRCGPPETGLVSYLRCDITGEQDTYVGGQVSGITADRVHWDKRIGQADPAAARGYKVVSL